MTLQLKKFHVAGNDIVVLDGRVQELPRSAKAYQHLADRHRGVGFDQAMALMEPADLGGFLKDLGGGAWDAADIQEGGGIEAGYVVVNADGSLSEQCGNGLCCLGAHQHSLDGKSEHRWQGPTRLVKTGIEPDGGIVAEMGTPDFRVEALPYSGLHSDGCGQLQVGGDLSLKFYLVSMGNPHAVIFLGQNQASAFDQLEHIGERLNDDESFPQGVNVSMVLPDSAGSAKIKVFERGAGLTLSCGSASCAALACARRHFGVQERLDLEHPGGRAQARWSGGDRPVFLCAAPCFIFHATVDSGVFV